MLFSYILQFLPDRRESGSVLADILFRLAPRLQEALDSALSIYCRLQVHQKEISVNIELYIQSGIVESYALGLATLTEREEFEQLMPHYQELKLALSDFEYQLELFAIDNEVPPPPEVRERIQARIQDIPAVRTSKNGNGRRHDQKGPGYLHIETSSNHIRVHKAWKTLFVVIFILSKIFLAFAIYYFLEYRHLKAAAQAAPPQAQVK